LLVKIGSKFTLWLFKIAMENGPFIDGLPTINGDFPWLCSITRWYPTEYPGNGFFNPQQGFKLPISNPQTKKQY